MFENIGDMFDEDNSEDSPPALGEALSDALLMWTEMLESVRALANSERLQLIGEGWDEENAQLMAMSVYGSFLSHLIGAPRV